MTVFDRIYDTLISLGLPVFLQGSLGENEPYPEKFITYWISDSEDESHYDDRVHTVIWYATIIFYSRDMLEIADFSKQIRNLLEEAGFIPQGKGNLIPSDEPGWVGYGVDFVYVEVQ